jgi:hypothetical protein
MKIVSARYGPKDVIEKVVPHFNGEKISIFVSNENKNE